MSISASTLRKLGALNLSPDQMAAVLDVFADQVQADEDRRAKQRARTNKSRAGACDRNVTVTLQDTLQPCDEACDSADIGSLSPIPLLSPTPPNNPLTPKPSIKSNSRASRLPDDWVLTGPNLAYALSKGFAEPQIVSMHEAFCAWAWSASGQNATKRNWDQAWRSWVLREKPNGNARAGPVRATTVYQRNRQEAREILDELDDFATGRSGGNQTHSGFLSGDSGERPEELRSGAGGPLIDLPGSSYRAGG